MNKIHKSEPKTMDVTRPKDTKTSDSPPRPIVQNRPILARSTPIGLSEATPEPAPSTEPTTAPTTHTKHVSIKPLSSDLEATNNAPTQKSTYAEDTTTDEDKSTAPQPPAQTEDQIESDTDPTTKDKSAKPSPETIAAVKEAKRKEELEDYIDSKQFFVPIDTVEQKRSILVSIGLTFLLFILAMLLIDLMLDSGFIDLINKLPHTHFFT